MRLPVEFQEVEYLESTGTQYIDTGFLSTINTVLICYNAYTQTTPATQINGIFSGEARVQFGINAGSFWFGIGDKQIDININVDLLKHKFVVDLLNKQYGFDNTITTDSTIVARQNNKSILLFSMLNALADVAVYYCHQKLYSCQIYDNDVLVRDFVPCYRKADSVAGLYDLVNAVFYTNAGTGTFIVGPDVLEKLSSFKSIAITEHETYITLEFNGEEYDLELSTPLSSPSANKIVFGSFAQVSITDNVLSIGDKSYELVVNTPTPTGYEVIFNDAMQWDDYYWSLSDASYSIDGGTTWETIPESLPITLSNVTQIMFKVTGTESGLPPRISCSDLGLDTGYTTNIETQNYPVSSNITINFEILFDD